MITIKTNKLKLGKKLKLDQPVKRVPANELKIPDQLVGDLYDLSVDMIQGRDLAIEHVKFCHKHKQWSQLAHWSALADTYTRLNDKLCAAFISDTARPDDVQF